MPKLYLASQSPRRCALLQQLGCTFEQLKLSVLETPQFGEIPEDYVLRVARDKAQAGLAQRAVQQTDDVVLGADTEVLLDGRIFGKPSDAEAATSMLRKLSGRTHQVVSAVWVCSLQTSLHAINCSEVRFTKLDEQVILEYVDSGEWLGKAGAYAIQGRGGALIEYLQGSYSGVMGLPLHETWQLLRAFAVPCMEPKLC